MQFRELLDKVTELDIKSYFQQNEEEIEYIDKYIKLFNDLKSKEPVQDDLKVFLVWQQDYFGGGLYISVLGFDPSDKESYALDFMSRERWLGCEIVDKSLKEFGEIAFVCECLTEMSFISFDEEVIAQEKEILEERIKEIKEGTVQYFSSEEVFNNIREEHDWEVHEVTIEDDDARIERIEDIKNFNEDKINEMLSEVYN